MNYYLFVLYTVVAISALYMWRQHKEIYLLIPYIALIGGFLFFLLWEAMGRYALPYVILVQPFAATGIGLLIMNAWGQVSKRYMRKGNAKNLETR